MILSVILLPLISDYKEKYVFPAPSLEFRKIPGNIFVTADFKRKNLPEIIKHQFDKIIKNNPDYTLNYYSDEEARDFIKEFYPEFLEDYDSIIPGAYKADLWRYLVLYEYGGVYMDIGHMPLLPLNGNVINDSDEFISCIEFNDLGIHNSFICVYPKHPILRKTIEITVENIRHRNYGINSVDITGPTTFQRGYNKHFDNDELSRIPEGTFVISDYKVKFFFHEYNDSDRYESYIVDRTRKNLRIIKTKFEDYEKVMYTARGKKKYHDLWRDREVYKNNK